jgi:hypothetical protein
MGFGREGLGFIFTLALLFFYLFFVSVCLFEDMDRMHTLLFMVFVLFFCIFPLLRDAVEHSCVGRCIHEMDGWMGVGRVKGDGGATLGRQREAFMYSILLQNGVDEGDVMSR